MDTAAIEALETAFPQIQPLAEAVKEIHRRLESPGGTSSAEAAQGDTEAERPHPLGLCEEVECRQCGAGRRRYTVQVAQATRKVILREVAEAPDKCGLREEGNRIAEVWQALYGAGEPVDIEGLKVA